MIKELAMNGVGLYTRKQYQDLDKRNCKLWDALNECVSFMGTYASVIKEMSGDKPIYGGGFETNESRMAYIRQICDKMTELEKKTKRTMFKAGRTELFP